MRNEDLETSAVVTLTVELTVPHEFRGGDHWVCDAHKQTAATAVEHMRAFLAGNAKIKLHRLVVDRVNLITRPREDRTEA